MNVVLILNLFAQVIGLITFMFFFGNSKETKWNKEDLKIVGLFQIPSDTMMWFSILFLHQYTPKEAIRFFLGEATEFYPYHSLNYIQIQIGLVITVLALGLAAIKAQQNKVSLFLLLIHIISLISFSIYIFFI